MWIIPIAIVIGLLVIGLTILLIIKLCLIKLVRSPSSVCVCMQCSVCSVVYSVVSACMHACV